MSDQHTLVGKQMGRGQFYYPVYGEMSSFPILALKEIRKRIRDGLGLGIAG